MHNVLEYSLFISTRLDTRNRHHDSSACRRSMEGMRAYMENTLSSVQRQLVNFKHNLIMPIGFDHLCVHCANILVSNIAALNSVNQTSNEAPATRSRKNLHQFQQQAPEKNFTPSNHSNGYVFQSSKPWTGFYETNSVSTPTNSSGRIRTMEIKYSKANACLRERTLVERSLNHPHDST